jgi:putative FmdB family regulatory protein
MPIYAYRCASCGHAKDVLQKLSDPLLTTCPACGAETFRKQLTAAGFQLKGSGWYVTDFKGGPPAAKPDAAKPEVPKPAGTAETAAQPGGEAAPALAPAKTDTAPASGAGASTPPAGGSAPAAQ